MALLKVDDRLGCDVHTRANSVCDNFTLGNEFAQRGARTLQRGSGLLNAERDLTLIY